MTPTAHEDQTAFADVAALERVSLALADVIDAGQLEEVVREATRLAGEEAAIPALEHYLCELLLRDEVRAREAAAAAMQALATVVAAEGGGHAGISATSLDALVAALAVESELSARAEQLWALSQQDYSRDELRSYVPLVRRIARSFVETRSQIDAETVDQMAYLYERLQGEDGKDPSILWPAERKLLGFAATGIPFLLSDPVCPKVVLIYNENLDAWLPPGGHFSPGMSQMPDETLIDKIQTEAGVSSVVHWVSLSFEDRGQPVQLRPAPSFVLREDPAL